MLHSCHIPLKLAAVAILLVTAGTSTEASSTTPYTPFSSYSPSNPESRLNDALSWSEKLRAAHKLSKKTLL
jgi:hypothetical protein